MELSLGEYLANKLMKTVPLEKDHQSGPQIHKQNDFYIFRTSNFSNEWRVLLHGDNLDILEIQYVRVNN